MFASIPSRVILQELWSNFTGFGSFSIEVFTTASTKFHECENFHNCRVPVQPRPILARKCNMFSSVSDKNIALSFIRRPSFTFCCIPVLISISKASSNVQILQPVHDIVGYQVSDLISSGAYICTSYAPDIVGYQDSKHGL